MADERDELRRKRCAAWAAFKEARDAFEVAHRCFSQAKLAKAKEKCNEAQVAFEKAKAEEDDFIAEEAKKPKAVRPATAIRGVPSSIAAALAFIEPGRDTGNTEHFWDLEARSDWFKARRLEKPIGHKTIDIRFFSQEKQAKFLEHLVTYKPKPKRRRKRR